MRIVSIFVALLAVAVTAVAGPAAAQQKQYEGPWCAIVMLGGDSYAQRCDMRSFEMCLAETQGRGPSHCTQNPYYQGKAEPQQRKRSRVQ